MRVLNPGPGEIVDRLTVVARKIVEGGERAKHFEEEFDLLVATFNQTLEELNDKVFLMLKFGDWFKLAALNAALWQREDEVRSFRNGRPPGTTDFSQLAFRIQELNDQRAKLVKEINAAAGIVREEKL